MTVTLGDATYDTEMITNHCFEKEMKMKKLILILIGLVIGGVLILNLGVNVTALAAGLAVTCEEQCDIDWESCMYSCDGDYNCEWDCEYDFDECVCWCWGYTGYDSETDECYY